MINEANLNKKDRIYAYLFFSPFYTEAIPINPQFIKIS